MAWSDSQAIAPVIDWTGWYQVAATSVSWSPVALAFAHFRYRLSNNPLAVESKCRNR
jgi:hypothetical protein